MRRIITLLIRFRSPQGRKFSEGRKKVLFYTHTDQNLVENLSLVLKVKKGLRTFMVVI